MYNQNFEHVLALLGSAALLAWFRTDATRFSCRGVTQHTVMVTYIQLPNRFPFWVVNKPSRKCITVGMHSKVVLMNHSTFFGSGALWRCRYESHFNVFIGHKRCCLLRARDIFCRIAENSEYQRPASRAAMATLFRRIFATTVPNHLQSYWKVASFLLPSTGLFPISMGDLSCTCQVQTKRWQFCNNYISWEVLGRLRSNFACI